MFEIKREGFWYSASESDYPMPKPKVLSNEEAEKIYTLIKQKESDKTTEKQCYRGFSMSRITGEVLGSCEYVTDEWMWPDSFADHYVLNHKVKPTDEFLDYLGYNKNPNKDDILRWVYGRVASISHPINQAFEMDIIYDEGIGIKIVKPEDDDLEKSNFEVFKETIEELMRKYPVE